MKMEQKAEKSDLVKVSQLKTLKASNKFVSDLFLAPHCCDVCNFFNAHDSELLSALPFVFFSF